MITQVALPPILTQTYPLDFGGFNEGIKKRPRSITEILKKMDMKHYLFLDTVL